MARRLGREDGAAAVEFALIVGVLSMLIFGMLEYGLFFLQDQSLKAAAREGARVAAVGGTRANCNGGQPCIQGAIVSGSGGALPAAYPCFYVTLDSGTSATACASPPVPTTKYCDQSANPSTLGREVIVTIPTGSGSADWGGLPSNVVQAFQIDIPFLPHLNVHPTITGSFRCEQ